MVFAVIKQFVTKEGTNMDGATFMLYMVLQVVEYWNYVFHSFLQY